jgi:23S rRNA (cytosine1962-C5)-methyltransferase
VNLPNTPKIVISPKAMKSIERRHPWIFSGAVRHADTTVEPGETVAVHAPDGRWLAWGACSPHSQIRVRLWSFDPHDTISADFFHRRLNLAFGLRDRLALVSPCTARRLVNAESDGLPGLIVDQYDDFLVCQFLAAGVERQRDSIVAALRRLGSFHGLYERSDTDARKKEGLPLRSGLLWGTPPPDTISVHLGGMEMLVDVVRGHKTGYYLDQRENQARIQRYANGKTVLNCFSYTGAFGLWALAGGASHVTNIDASESTLALAEQNRVRNRLPAERWDQVAANVFEQLRAYRDSGRQFDLIVLDPPKFVASAGQLDKGCRGYKDINLLAFKCLAPRGVLFTFSCSGLVAPNLFQKIVFDAAMDAGRQIQLIDHLHQAADHPIALTFPQAHYLKGLVCIDADE